MSRASVRKGQLYLAGVNGQNSSTVHAAEQRPPRHPPGEPPQIDRMGSLVGPAILDASSPHGSWAPLYVPRNPPLQWALLAQRQAPPRRLSSAGCRATYV